MAEYIGQCDKIRRTPEGEILWQAIMNRAEKIPMMEFIKAVGHSVRVILDDGENVTDWMRGDPDAYFAKAVLEVTDVEDYHYYFIGHSGFEFIWKI